MRVFIGRSMCVWVVITFICAAIVQFHWIGFASGTVVSMMVILMNIKAIKADYSKGIMNTIFGEARKKDVKIENK